MDLLTDFSNASYYNYMLFDIGIMAVSRGRSIYYYIVGCLIITKEEKLKVYIAGALSSKESNNRTPSKVVVDYLDNVNKMCRVASEVRKKGYSPYVPALDFALGMINGNWEEEDYRGLGMEFMEVCDAVLVISDSWGVQQEVSRAKELFIPIYYSLEELYGE